MTATKRFFISKRTKRLGELGGVTMDEAAAAINEDDSPVLMSRLGQLLTDKPVPVVAVKGGSRGSAFLA